MKSTLLRRIALTVTALLVFPCLAQDASAEDTLKVHNIFSSNMVIQRGKPIKVWGWATPGDTVTVKLGEETAEAEVGPAEPVEVFGHEKEYAGKGRWEATFPAREASADPQKLVVTAGGEKVELTNVVIGDVWVMSGQSNMAFPAGKTNVQDMLPQADIPSLRLFSIKENEQATLQDDIRPETIVTESGGWDVSSYETARGFSAIGFAFGLELQHALHIPIGVIKAARGGASIESLVPVHKFDDHPLAKRYADHVRKRMAEFDPEAKADEIWERQKARAKRKGKPEPPRPDPNDLRSWSVPGKSPSDMGSVHNGFFGVFKGYNIKGVLFHQGYNNTIGDVRPKRYRVLMKLMVEGWREDFNDPDLPVGVIGFCAGSKPQTRVNFELDSIDTGPFIRESQRLGLADVGDPENTEFIPAYDVQTTGLHPSMKREHGWRAAQWALDDLYGVKAARWETVSIPSVEPHGDMMIVRFGHKERLQAPNKSPVLEGFSVAGEDGKFYMAHARYEPWGKNETWTKGWQTVRVWSPMVDEPVALRYGWATSPMGNLKYRGDQDIPMPSFRTDDWDYPESDDPTVEATDRRYTRNQKKDAQARLEARRLKETTMGRELIERLEALAAP